MVVGCGIEGDLVFARGGHGSVLDRFGVYECTVFVGGGQALDNGADIRIIQQMPGHVCIDTTEIYTHVSIMKPEQIHEMTHCTRSRPKTAIRRPRKMRWWRHCKRKVITRNNNL